MRAPYPDQFRDRLRELFHRERFAFPEGSIPDHFREASVLLPFWEEGGEIFVVMIRRSTKNSRHAGQVAFPGGLLEEGESWESAAIREANEEVGIDPTSVEVLGYLDDAWSGAGSHIVPIVAWLRSVPRLTASPTEVAEILVPRISDLLLPEARGEEEVTVRGVRYVDPTLTWPGGCAYGLTADLLLEVLDWAVGCSPSRGPHRLRDLLAFTSSGDPHVA
jgi:8-oxo-dGTP pyrophosphatase MutT (NUDIX family)